MNKLLRISGYLLIGFIGLIGLTVIVLALISDEQYKSWTTAAAESVTGRKLDIGGTFDLQLGTKVGILAREIKFSNATWGSRENMVTADQLFVQLSLLPLFKGVLDLTVELEGPDVLLETDKKGTGNWLFTGVDEAASEPDVKEEPEPDSKPFVLPLKPYIRNFEIKDLLFSFNNQETEQNIKAGLELLKLYVDNDNLPVTIKGVYQDTPVILKGILGNINDWYRNQQTPITLEGMLNEATIGIKGTAGPMFPEPAVHLELTLAAENIATLAPFAGTALPELAGLDISLSAEMAKGVTAIQNIEINLNDPELLVDLNGSISDIVRLTGIDLKADISTRQGTALTEKFGALSIQSIPDSLKLQANLKGDLDALVVSDLNISVQDDGVDINLTGKMDNLIKLEGTEAQLAIDIDTIDTIGHYIGQDLPAFGPLEISAQLSSVANMTQLESLLVNLSDPTLSASISGSTGDIMLKDKGTLSIKDIKLSARANSEKIQGIMEKVGIELPVPTPASFSLETTAAGDLQKLGIPLLSLSIKDEGIDINLNASAENVLEQTGIKATLNTNVASAANLSKFAGMELPDVGPLTLKSQISSADKTYQLESLDFNLTDKDFQARIQATIKDLLVLSDMGDDHNKIGEAGIDIRINADISSVSDIVEETTGFSIVDLGGLKLDGRIHTNDELLGLHGLHVKLDGKHLLATINGEIQDLLVLTKAAKQPELMGTAGIDISLASDIPSVSRLADNLGVKRVPDIGGLNLNGHLLSAGQTLQLQSIQAALKKEGLSADLKASITDIMTSSGLNGTLTAQLDSLSTLSSITGSELPESGPWMLNSHASLGSLKSPLLFNVQLEGEGTKTIVDATIPDIQARQNLLAQVSIDAGSLSRIGDIFDKDLPENESLKLKGKLSVEPGQYSVEKFMVLLGEGRLISDLTYRLPAKEEGGRKKIEGTMSIQNLDISPFLESTTPPPDESAASDAEPPVVEAEKPEIAGSDSGKKLFSNKPLAIGPLQDFDVNLELDAKAFTIRKNFIIDGSLAITLEEGLLKVDPIYFTGQHGEVAEGKIELDARDVPAGLDILLEVDDFVFPRLGGKFDLDVDLDSKGESIAELMGNLNGRFITKINDAEMSKSYLTQYGAGLLSQFNPLDSDMTTLECAIARLDIEDGMVNFEDRLAAQTTEVTWLGGGNINLKTEELDMAIAPTARQAISSLTNIGLASLVHIGGTLAEPRIGLDTMDVAKKYAQYSAIVATGGLSFLAQKAYENRVSNLDHCERILADLEEEKK